MKFLLLPPDGPPEIRDVDPTLENLQALVGGYIERWSLLRPDGGLLAALYCNEDGKRLRLPENTFASLVFEHFDRPGFLARDRLVGPAFLAGPETRDGDMTDVPAAVAGEVLRLHKTLGPLTPPKTRQ